MNFLKDNVRFSFMYDGVSAFDYLYTSKSCEKDGALITEYLFEDTLKITNTARKIEKFGAYEWVNSIENVSGQNSRLISELWDADFKIAWNHTEPKKRSPWQSKVSENTIIHATRGSVSSADDFADEARMIFHGQCIQYNSRGGRSTDNYAPYFNINKNGHGIMIGLGWTGQWRAAFDLESDHLRIRAKIEDTEFFVMPKEKFRTLSVTVMEYDGSVADGQNLWRRLMKEEYSDTISRVKNLPICMNFWGGLESDEVIRRIKAYKDAEVPFTHTWMDAGWCGIDTLPTFDEFTGDWYEKVGDWRISNIIHPNGLRDVAKCAKASGFKYLLWFEPERAKASSPIVSEHPEYFLSDGGSNRLINLGNPEAYTYITEIVFKMIAEIGIECYRQDFNFSPLTFWRANDTEGRRGITEIMHINALYRFFDEMLERFPTLIIDNCASGGRRLDMEMMRRSFPLWRSDAQCAADPTPEITQVNNMNFSNWLPYTATGSGRLYDDYAIRSAYSSGMSTNYGFSKSDVFYDTPSKIEWIKGKICELHSIRKFFGADMYMLTAPTTDITAWCATEWVIPESYEGMIQIFKRAESPYTEATFTLHGIDESKVYIFTDLDGGSFEICGKELKDSGFRVKIIDKRVAKIYTFAVKA